MNRYFIVLLSTFSLVFTGLPLLSAQESATEEFTLEEITVTAQKREENQQKVPIAMEVITGEQMNEKGMNNIDEILKDVSSAIINSSSDGMRVAIRGIANDNSTQKGQTVSTPTVAVNIDGAYNSSNTAGQALFDIERVEVLSGPQSTMYASNSPGGIVNIVTASPKTDKYSASGSIEYGNYNLLNLQASVNVPVVQDKVALRAAVNMNKRDTYIDGGNSTTAEDAKSARLKALYQANDELSITLTGNYSKSGGGGGMGGGVVMFDNQDEVDDPWTASNADTGNNTSDRTSKGLSAEFAWEMGFASLTVVPSYSESEQSQFETMEVRNGMGPDATTTYEDAYRDNENVQKGAEARMASSSDFTLFKWILGGNYYRSEDTRGTDYVDPDAFDESNTNEQKSKAVFANITYPVSGRFRTTGGYRYSWDSMNNIESARNAPGGLTNATTYSTQEYSHPDYKLGVEYDLAENSMIYADRSTSYRVNAMGSTDDPPERMVSYTVGAKNRFFDNK
ncbi:MAG: TonB-dependent receptor, partial [Deltaproteobacteria bacterium]|nr:TonB-dependent receptor [Deltaproteobacteria bacterium]